jgi:ubiquinone/menaquinone biosynthesis C-methylase UbiE
MLHEMVCPYYPWWLAYAFDNPMRKYLHNPVRILSPYVKPGMNVLDIGCGMGFFSLALAQLVGKQGRVHSVDIQPRMLHYTRVRAQRACLADIIEPELVLADDLGDSPAVDFALAFWMVHEVPDQTVFFSLVRKRLKSDGRFLMVEPKVHVTARAFGRTLAAARDQGWLIAASPSIAASRAVVLTP